jgi:transposase
MPQAQITRFLLLPELKLDRWTKVGVATSLCEASKESLAEVCPSCASLSSSVYDTRKVRLKDQPIRGKQVILLVTKRRFFCRPCKKPFTEPLAGVRKGGRTTERYRRGILWAAENFSDLKRVTKEYRCSSWLVYRAVHEHLALNLKRDLSYPWPKTIGIDEHFVTRRRGFREFATVVIDYNNKRPRELILGRSSGELHEGLGYIPGRENVKNVILDLSDGYKSFTKNFFPNAQLIADKFHVLRLLTPHLNRRRKLVTGDVRSNPVRRLLLTNRKKLDYFKRRALDQWLDENPELFELYWWKEQMHSFYRIKRTGHAARVLTKITDRMASSNLPEIKTLRRTLMKWRNEILNYFTTRLTNARTEGFNNVAKLIQKRSYGVKSFEMYRLKYLNATA